MKAGLDQDVTLGIIEPMPAGTPTTWLSRMVVAPKMDGSPCHTVDLQKVNKLTLRETHYSTSPQKLVASIHPNQKKSVLDCWNGYHSLKLTETA